MASWQDLVDYVRNTYKIADESDGVLKMLFDVGGGRSQTVLVTRHKLGGGSEDWVKIVSPVGKANDSQLSDLIQAAGTKVCGGLGSIGDIVTYQHAFPLENFDVNEFDRPLILITSTADDLEKEFVGGDQF